ncbi:MAG: LptF/LptG family permease [Proteobacteria bacterium]|nr:LptF/LptG family permease [Pseudomonadota bacterium]
MVLTWYILRQCLSSLLLASFSIIGLVWLGQTLRLVELLVNKGALFIDFLYVTLLGVPFWLLIILPISSTIAATSVMSKMQQDKELLAMSAAGISPIRIGLGPMIMGGLITMFLMINSAYLMPATYSQYKTFMTNLRTSAPIIILQEGVFIDITKGLTIYINQKQSDNVFKDVFIRDSRNEDVVIEIHSEKATVSIDNENPSIVLFNGIRTQFSDSSTKAQILEFESYELNMTQKSVTNSNRPQDYNEMSIGELLTKTISNSQYQDEMRAEGHFRLTAPILALSLVIMVIAVFLRSRFQRGHYWYQICIVTGLTVFIELAHLTARSMTVNLPGLFPLMYFVVFLPLVIGFLTLWQPWRKEALPA